MNNTTSAVQKSPNQNYPHRDGFNGEPGSDGECTMSAVPPTPEWGSFDHTAEIHVRRITSEAVKWTRHQFLSQRAYSHGKADHNLCPFFHIFEERTPTESWDAT